MATRLLDTMVEWEGWPNSTTQVLGWPRSGLEDRNGNAIDASVIPADLKNATAEFARQLLAKDRTADSDVETDGISRVKAGPVEVEFENPVQVKVVPDSVFYLLPESWGSVRGRSSTRRLVRT